jgi:hypothetical protein
VSDACNPDFAQLAAQLGFPCSGAPAIVDVRNPLGLTNWTLPVVELLMVSGAVLALWYAIRRLRRDGDPTNLALWFAAVLYLLLIEPPEYFPEAFGVGDQLGIVFAHNVFTVDFLYDRLPLYIVALYPTTITLAFDVVRAVGVFTRRGPLVGAVCVGFVNASFYEVFDHLGPQLQWWAWNVDNPLNHPMMNAVPMTSVALFAMLAPAALAFFVYVLIGRHSAGDDPVRGWACEWRTRWFRLPSWCWACRQRFSHTITPSWRESSSQSWRCSPRSHCRRSSSSGAALDAKAPTTQALSSRYSGRSTWSCSQHSGWPLCRTTREPSTA